MNEDRPLRVSISIRIDTYGSQNASTAMRNLALSEEFNLGVADFSELAAILGQFHQLATKIKIEQ